MLTLVLILFLSGLLTILLPCVLPLVPIVLGTSITGRNKWRPLMVIVGMLISFVLFTFVLTVILGNFPMTANYIRITTYYVLLLFGIGFLTENIWVRYLVTIFGSLFFLPDLPAIIIAVILGCIAMHFGGYVASWLQNFGAGIQREAQASFGTDHPLGGLLIGLTLGLVWVPCAGPALGFVFTLLRERPGFEAMILLAAYGLGTALPLLLIGYGGQYAVHSVRALSRFSGYIKQVAGGLLIFSALALQFNWFTALQTWLVLNTDYGTLGTQVEEKFFGEELEKLKLEQPQ